MPSDLTAAEVVSAAAPVAGALGIIDIEACGEDDIPDEVLVRFHDRMIAMEPNDAARLLVGMVAEKCCSYAPTTHSAYASSTRGAYASSTRGATEWYDGPRSLRTIFLATMRAFARAKGGES